MKIYIKYSIFLLAAVTSLTSCTKVVDLKLGNSSGQLVIEGNITNVNGPQYVVLTTNVPFSNTNTYPPVTGATVTISDQLGHKYSLIEGPQGTYAINPLAGKAGNTYNLNVLVNSTSYNASSTLPALVALDSVTAKTSPFNNSSNGKVEKEITVHYQDPAGVSNQYRFLMWVNGVQVKSIFAFDDQLTDGRSVSSDLREDDITIYSGDTVKVEMQCIDKPVYLYWFTLMQQQAKGAAGSVAPSNPPTNLTPATLGYFSAHTTQTQTIVVK
jgi:hypothetical protein